MNSYRRTLGKTLSSSLALGSVGLLPTLTGCMAPARKAPEFIQDSARIEGLATRSGEPKLMVGQAWEFQAINMYNGESLGNVLHRVQASTDQGIKLALLGERTSRLETFSERWQVTQEAHHDATLRFERPVTLIPKQLSPGTAEHFATRYVVLPEGGKEPSDPVFRDLYWKVYVDVIGWETLQVPAGRFDVARIQRRIYFKHFDSFRAESTRVETLWYAPQVGYWVAREWTGLYLAQGNRRRGGQMREDRVRWELKRSLGPPSA
jgi:hypothetical protein